MSARPDQLNPFQAHLGHGVVARQLERLPEVGFRAVQVTQVIHFCLGHLGQ